MVPGTALRVRVMHSHGEPSVVPSGHDAYFLVVAVPRGALHYEGSELSSLDITTHLFAFFPERHHKDKRDGEPTVLSHYDSDDSDKTDAVHKSHC